MTRFLTCLPVLATLLFAAPAHAQSTPGPVVVELYTSQGCSSCPPADKLLERLATRDDVLALALHVDYWDYLGWKDAFASPAYSQRQKGYAHVAGRKMVYTPQMVIMGREDIVGTDAMAVADLVAEYRTRPAQAHVALERNGDTLTIRLGPTDTSAGNYDVQLVRFTPHQTVDIKRGENAGQSVTYANVVHSWDVLGRWNGETAREVSVDIAGDLPLAVLVQHSGLGPIIAAKVLR